MLLRHLCDGRLLKHRRWFLHDFSGSLGHHLALFLLSSGSRRPFLLHFLFLLSLQLLSPLALLLLLLLLLSAQVLLSLPLRGLSLLFLLLLALLIFLLLEILEGLAGRFDFEVKSGDVLLSTGDGSLNLL